MESTDLQLSIVVPTHRRADSLVRLLKSFKHQDLQPDHFEVIVVSNLPDQETELKLSQLTPKHQMHYFTAGKVGVNWARNLGLSKAKADFVFFLDDDCELTHNDHFSRLITIHKQLPHVAAVGGLYTLPAEANPYERAYTKMSNDWVKDSLDKDLMQVERLLGGNVCYKKSLLKKADLEFNSAIVFGGAETELHNRMVKNFMDMRLSNLSVRHHVKLDAQTFFAKAIRQGYGSHFQDEKSDPNSLQLLSKKRLSFLNFQYRHLFRVGQKKANRGETWPSAKISRRKMWAYELESRTAKLASDSYAAASLAYWTAYHHILVVLGKVWKQVGYVWKLAVVGFHKAYWPAHGSAIQAGHYIRSFAVKNYRKYVVGAFWKLAHSTHFVFDVFRHQVPAFLQHKLPEKMRTEMKRLNVRLRAGFDDRLAGYKFSVSDKPSVYFPISKTCTKNCDYCGLIRAKDQFADFNLSNTDADELTADLKHMGYNRLTIPCNLAAMSSSEADENLAALGQFDKELLLNPDILADSNWQALIKDWQVKGFEFLLLHRPGNSFREIYKFLKKGKAPYRVLSVQDVSPELSSLYSTLYPEDHQLVEWLSTSAVEPVLRDPKNRKRAQNIARTLKFFEKEDIKTLPKTSNLHYPFLVPTENVTTVLPSGEMAWSSDSFGQAGKINYSIVIPVRFQISHACKVLRNLSANAYEKSSFEVIFVDDGNDQPLSPEIAKCFQEHCDSDLKACVVRWDRKAGDRFDDSYRAGQARNLGVRHSRGERLMFVDSDILISPQLLFDLDSQLGDKMLVQFPRHMMKESASHQFMPYEQIDQSEHTYKQNHYWEQFKATKDWESLKNYWKYTCTYGLAVTRKTFESVGPFRSEYIYYGFEDVDFGYRLYQSGAKFLLLNSPVYHLYPDKENSFHFDQQKRFNALSRSASIFLHRNFDLAFYMDLNHFLDSSVSLRLLKPYYYLRYRWKALSGTEKTEKPRRKQVQPSAN
ncbi:MAG: glycosyltransferase [Bdellovibrionales bacterium]|nr:glycosyltransferase [Bdellovibrionales bacterium]